MKYFKQKLLLLLSFIFLLNLSCQENTSDIFQKERENMVKYQIEKRGIEDEKVISAMREIPRHYFVPEEVRDFSYEDRPLPIGFGQTISQPYIVALMTELLCLTDSSKVLEIGTGSGYQAAILSEITDSVYTIEIVEELHNRTNRVFRKYGFDEIKTKSGDGYFGWLENAPYDAIIVTCASEFIPPPLIKQLKIGGKMCIPVGPPFRVQSLDLITKKSGIDIQTEIITYVRFVPLTRRE